MALEYLVRARLRARERQIHVNKSHT
jgi:hypothetical protein